MTQPRSQLIYRDFECTSPPPRATVILMHGHGGHHDDLVPLGRSLGADVGLVICEAPRATYFGRDTVAHYWYIGERCGRPDPPTFGDCLFQVEQFVLDVLERRDGGPLPYLLGFDQGAVLALAATKVIPDRLAGVMAVCGYLPEIQEAPLPVSELDGLPVIDINDPDDAAVSAALIDRTSTRLTHDGASIESVSLSGARELGPGVQQALRDWLAARTDDGDERSVPDHAAGRSEEPGL
jgi:phospholipase/carboxylesterase